MNERTERRIDAICGAAFIVGLVVFLFVIIFVLLSNGDEEVIESLAGRSNRQAGIITQDFNRATGNAADDGLIPIVVGGYLVNSIRGRLGR